MKKLWSFEDDRAKNQREFRNCEMGCKIPILLQESPLTEITHTKPLTPFLTSLKPSEPIAPTKETMPPKETTKAEAKVLIQPTQEATTDASAPQDLTIT